MFFKKENKSLSLPESTDYIKQLKVIPLKNKKINIVRKTENKIVFSVKLKYPKLVVPFKNILKLSEEKKYEIKGIGFVIYEKIDGRRNLKDLVEYLQNTYKLSFFEARSLLIQYLKLLSQKSIIAVGLKKRKDTPKG